MIIDDWIEYVKKDRNSNNPYNHSGQKYYEVSDYFNGTYTVMVNDDELSKRGDKYKNE